MILEKLKEFLGLSGAKMVIKKPPVWEAYNGQIAKMRWQGNSLQTIGDTIGVSRERVRQILEKHYGTTEVPLPTRNEAAEIIGCSQEALRKLEGKGLVNPQHSGAIHYYNNDIIEIAKSLLQKQCPHCGISLPMKHQGKYCTKCKIDRVRNSYPFCSPEGKRKRLEAALSWMKRHPKQNKEIQGRSCRKYEEKRKREHFATIEYIVVAGNVLPIGTTFKAVGCENHYLLLENGVRIPLCCIRKKEG